MVEVLKTMEGRMHDRISTTTGLITLIAFAALAVYIMIFTLDSVVVRVVPGR